MKKKWWKAGTCVPLLAMIAGSLPAFAQDADTAAALRGGFKLAALAGTKIHAPDTASCRGIDRNIQALSYGELPSKARILPGQDGTLDDRPLEEGPLYENQFPDIQPDTDLPPGEEDEIMEDEPLEEVMPPGTPPGDEPDPDDPLFE